MSVRVKAVKGKSGFFKTGDEIIAVDSDPIEDQLDLIFLTAGEGSKNFVIRRRGGVQFSRKLTADAFDRARLLYEDMEFRSCRSNCIFCFIDQMPPGLRRSLYDKDDDYRLSFLFGNYVTLNDVGERDIKRIIRLKLSPIFISVHAVDRETREYLFGRPMRNDILEVIGRLARGGITMHIQVVLIPGINDGRILESTVREIFRFYPSCRSLSVVPVGLTRHRGGLRVLRGVDEKKARSLVRWAEGRRKEFSEKTGGEYFLHMADELYLLARRSIPEESSYDGFPQLANGVGMCRVFIEKVKGEIDRLCRLGYDELEIAVVTGVLGGRFLRKHVIPLIDSNLPGFKMDLIVIRNRLFGRNIGVSGLLAGRDIISAVKQRGKISGCLVIPPNALNHEGLFIDDVRPRDLERELGLRVLVPKATFLENRVLRLCKEA